MQCAMCSKRIVDMVVGKMVGRPKCRRLVDFILTLEAGIGSGA